MIRKLGLVVEGHGEVEAVPVLVRRITHELLEATGPLDVLRPVRIKRQRVHMEEFERTIADLGTDVGPSGAMLVLIDADEDCPARLAPELLRRAASARADRPIAVVIATVEFESWFLASLASLRSVRGIPLDALDGPDPELVKNPKHRLTELCGYSPAADQAALAARMDLRTACRRAPSFDKLCRELARLVIA